MWIICKKHPFPLSISSINRLQTVYNIVTATEIHCNDSFFISLDRAKLTILAVNSWHSLPHHGTCFGTKLPGVTYSRAYSRAHQTVRSFDCYSCSAMNLFVRTHSIWFSRHPFPRLAILIISYNCNHNFEYLWKLFTRVSALGGLRSQFYCGFRSLLV